MTMKNTYMVASVVVFLLLFSGWIWRGNTALEVNEYEMISNRIPEAFSGFRIAQISDLHNAQFGERNEGLLSLLSQADPDIIVITGDLIDSRHTDIQIALEFCESAIEIAPVYYVTGNHEAWVTEYEDLKKYALEDRLEIKRELEIIQPDIIVCGNNLSLLKLVLGEELQNDDTWDNMLALWKDTLVLDYYHPAVHYPNRVNYYALMAICDVARKKYGTPVWSEQNEKY